MGERLEWRSGILCPCDPVTRLFGGKIVNTELRL